MEKMRNILAILLGIVVLFSIIAIVTFFLMNFGIEPFNKFATGNFNETQFFNLAQKIIILNILLILPAISFGTGLFSGLVAKSREYFIGIICVTPLFIMFYDFSLSYLFMLLSTIISVIIGVRVAKLIKKRINLRVIV